MNRDHHRLFCDKADGDEIAIEIEGKLRLQLRHHRERRCDRHEQGVAVALDATMPCVAIMPPPPGRLLITACCRQALVSRSPTMRVMTSGPPPAPDGKMIVTARLG